jgi:hypothetical protein
MLRMIRFLRMPVTSNLFSNEKNAIKLLDWVWSAFSRSRRGRSEIVKASHADSRISSESHEPWVNKLIRCENEAIPAFTGQTDADSQSLSMLLNAVSPGVFQVPRVGPRG